MSRIYFESSNDDWGPKIVEKLRKIGLDYEQTTEWKESEIIVADLNCKKIDDIKITVMLGAREGKVSLREPPPVICANPTGASGEPFKELRDKINTYMKCNINIYKNDDDIVNFIKWLDHFLPRKKTVPQKEITPDGIKTLINTVITDAMNPKMA